MSRRIKNRKPKAKVAEVRVNTVHTTLKRSVENTSSGGRYTPELSIKDKGKRCQVEIHTPSEEERDDAERLAQIQADAETAQLLQDELDRLLRR